MTLPLNGPWSLEMMINDWFNSSSFPTKQEFLDATNPYGFKPDSLGYYSTTSFNYRNSSNQIVLHVGGLAANGFVKEFSMGTYCRGMIANPIPHGPGGGGDSPTGVTGDGGDGGGGDGGGGDGGGGDG